jgi:hypothetical protein
VVGIIAEFVAKQEFAELRQFLAIFREIQADFSALKT